MISIDLSGRRALVCGASAGLGLAVAEALSAAGAEVLISARSQERLDAAAAKIESKSATGSRPVTLVADLTSVADIEAMTQSALEGGAIDILVNNAGGPPSGTFDDLSEADWRRAVDLTLMSAVETTRRILPAMRQQRWGRIINVTSTSVKQPVEALLLSNSIRLAVIGWAKTLANEVGPDNVLVNSVGPGFTATERLDQLAAAAAERRGIDVEQIRAAWRASVPLRRIAEPSEFAGPVLFLASELASYVTGTMIAIDGGRNQSMM